MSLQQPTTHHPGQRCRSPLPVQHRLEHRTGGAIATLSCWPTYDLVLTALAEERLGHRAAGGRGTLPIMEDAFGATSASFPLDP